MTAQPVEPERPALRLRAWQAEALARYRENTPADFLVTATPGAGKTSFALALASDLLGKRVIDRVIVVAPTDHLRTQWAVAADRLGLRLDPTLGNDTGPVRADLHGYVTTYAHLGTIGVQSGQRVSRGDATVTIGQTGDVESPQLHFEIRHDMEPVDPRPLLMASRDS